ncbi:response regulator [Paenibacillus sp. GSMTC-2017]|uniref:response regulator transcription factor n=1 Tax=Paenibacillus sp. GSMTC-2017 TaxID=2794350 RepID=UPI0018D694CE|nr:response regulator [Paenibacillus sp. GSMTC-2017]MBH5318576.1 response regulator [Paenibacillus sp. GSMTC-2017]
MKKVLIVDDDEILRMLIADTLEDLDVQIDTAEDGRIALEKLSTTSYDLMLLDYMMPELSGVEVMMQLPSELKARMPIVMLTAKAQEADRKGAMEAGAHSFIPKPFSPMQLLQVVEQLLENEFVR